MNPYCPQCKRPLEPHDCGRTDGCSWLICDPCGYIIDTDTGQKTLLEVKEGT